MDELLALFPVLFIIYLFQCVAISPPSAFVFLVDTSLRGRLLRYFWPIGLNGRKMFLANPLSCFRQAMFVAAPPFSFATDRAGEIVGLSSLQISESAQNNSLITLTGAHRFEHEMKKLLCDDLPIAQLPSEPSARRLAHFLDALQAAPPRQRKDMVDNEIYRTLSVQAIKDRLQLFSQQTVWLVSLCFFLFLYVFLLAPVAIYVNRLHRAWPILVATLLATALAIAWNFRRVHRVLYPDGTEGIAQHLLAISLSPLAAIRAMDPLASTLLEEFHPVAVACVVLSKQDFLVFAERELRNAKFVLHDAILENHLIAFLSKQKLVPSKLLSPPHPDSPQSLSFCPACLTQFVIEEGVCRECGDVPLHKL